MPVITFAWTSNVIVARPGAAALIVPLGIVVVDEVTDSVSYMAPWSDDDAQQSLKSTHMYQFGGCAAWLSPTSLGPIPVVPLAWHQLRELQGTFFQFLEK